MEYLCTLLCFTLYLLFYDVDLFLLNMSPASRLSNKFSSSCFIVFSTFFLSTVSSLNPERKTYFVKKCVHQKPEEFQLELQTFYSKFIGLEQEEGIFANVVSLNNFFSRIKFQSIKYLFFHIQKLRFVCLSGMICHLFEVSPEVNKTKIGRLSFILDENSQLNIYWVSN